MPTLPHAVRPAQRRAALAVGVAIALMLAQWLGLVHRVVHDQAHSSQHRLGALFDGHGANGADCHLFDQLTHADALGAMPSVLPAVPLPAALSSVHASWQLAAQAVGSLARGPPPLA